MVDVIPEKNEINQEQGLPNITVEDTKEMLESVKLKKGGEEKVVKKDTIKVAQDNIVEDVEKTKELYAEFSSFLENKAEMTPDSEEKKTIPTGIDLIDAILGGGFVIGALSMIIGQSGCGKTMLACQVLGQGQKKYKGKLIGAFLDSEEATTSIRLANLGAKYPSIKPYIDITVEKVFKFLEGLCLFKQTKKIVDIPSVVIWDSIANTLSQKEREAEDVNSVIGYKARMLSILIPKYIAKTSKNNICFIAINQLRDVLNIGQFSPPRDLKFMTASKSIPGGNTLIFNTFQLIEMKIKSVVDRDKMGFDGVIVKLKCVKNKLFAPNIEIEVVGSFVTGFSNFWTNYHFMNTMKRLQTGAWNFLISLPDKKFRTKDAYTLYKEDEIFRNAFDASAKETIQTEIVDKYNQELL